MGEVEVGEVEVGELELEVEGSGVEEVAGRCARNVDQGNAAPHCPSPPGGPPPGSHASSAPPHCPLPLPTAHTATPHDDTTH